MTVRPIIFSGPMVRALLEGRKTQTRRLASSPLAKCKLGDLLWVRESWKPHSLYAGMKPRDMPHTHVFYLADDAYAPRSRAFPSIHMPRWASRITLEVKAVKTEPLQTISLADAICEGCEVRQHWLFGMDTEQRNAVGQRAFRAVWDSVHGARSWQANPEVVAISFTVHKLNVDEFLRRKAA